MTSLRVNPLALAHKDTYEAISSRRPELSQAGKTVLVTGGGVGVGYAVANSFAKAGASAIVLVGRRQEVLQSAAEKLKADYSTTNPGLKVHVRTVDVTDSESTASLWSWLAEKEIIIDVLILNAGKQSPLKTMLELGLKEVWEFYKVNVYGHMDFAENFYKQDRRGSPGPAVLINVSTAGSWDLVSCAPVPVYSLTKNSGTMLLQQIAQDVPAETMRIVNYHPGLIKTQATEDVIPEEYFPGGIPWDSPELAGDFAVWLTSPDAAFLHGRFVQAAWDVDELKAGKFRERIDNDPFFLKVGILGFHP
ncbi:Fc.00g022150.m01.CDS01 [Cosmosporella sp. VM-42]